MKICVVLNGLEQGGVTSSAMYFCEEMVRQGNSVDLVDICNGERIDSTGVKNIHIPMRQSLWSLDSRTIRKYNFLLLPFLIVLAIVKKVTNKKGQWLPIILRNYILSEFYDIVFAYRQCAPCYYFSLHCVKARKKVAMIHGDINYMGDISSWSNMLSLFDCVACVSNAVAEGFRERFPEIQDKFSTLYNMFDIAGIIDKAKEASPFSVDANIINIVTVARHENNHKKVNRVAEICLLLKTKGVSDIHWYVIGTGPDFNSNVAKAKEMRVDDMITYCGSMNNPFALMSKCDFMVLTSLTEAYGMVVVEGRILGLPSIVADFPSLSEILEDGADGMIAKQDVGDIADCIIKMIGNQRQVLNAMRQYILTHPYSNKEAINQANILLSTC